MVRYYAPHGESRTAGVVGGRGERSSKASRYHSRGENMTEAEDVQRTGAAEAPLRRLARLEKTLATLRALAREANDPATPFDARQRALRALADLAEVMP